MYVTSDSSMMRDMDIFSKHFKELQASGFPNCFSNPAYSYQDFEADMTYFVNTVDRAFNDTVGCDLEDMEDLCMIITQSILTMLKHPKIEYRYIYQAILQCRMHALKRMKERAALKIDDDAESIHEFRANFRQDSRLLHEAISKKWPGKTSYHNKHLRLLDP